MPQRVKIIMNPVSGRTRGDHALMRLFRRLREAGAELELFRTTGPGDARRLGREAAWNGAELVVVAGGDGTVSEVVSGLRGAAGAAKGEGATAMPPVLIAPRGTENVLAKYLGLRLDGDELAEAALSGRAQEIDLGLCNGRSFMVVAGVGFDAEVVRRVHAVRGRHLDYGAYFWPLWRAFWSYRHPAICVDVDGQRVFEGRGLAIAGNIPRYAMGLRILRNARSDDGLMDVCIFAVRTRRGLIHRAIRAALARHVGCPGVVYGQGRTIRITVAKASPPSSDAASQRGSLRGEPAGVCVELDGDPGGALPIELEVIPRGARFIVPRGWRV